MKAFILITTSLEFELLLEFLFAYFSLFTTDVFMRRHLRILLREGVVSKMISVYFFHKVMRSKKIQNQLFLSSFSFLWRIGRWWCALVALKCFLWSWISLHLKVLLSVTVMLLQHSSFLFNFQTLWHCFISDFQTLP
jgi:hypothetical protein